MQPEPGEVATQEASYISLFIAVNVVQSTLHGIVLGLRGANLNCIP